MRHIVRKSKVHIINKLTRDAKKLRIKKGTEKQIAKHKKKAERFINELLAIKVYNYIHNLTIFSSLNILLFFIEIKQ